MKKIFAVFFAVLVFISSLAIPCAAYDADETAASKIVSVVESYLPSTGKANYVILHHTGIDCYLVCYADEPVIRSSDNCIGGGYSDFSDVCVFCIYDVKNGSLVLSNRVVGTGDKCSYRTSIYLVVASSTTVYYSNGDVFFQAPPPPQPGLAESVEDLIVNQGKALLQKVSGVMKTLAPFGVGCLALLTALPVLRKVLGRFLPV